MGIVFPILASLLFAIVYAWATASLPWCARHRRITGGALAAVLVLEMVARRIDLRWHVGGSVHTALSALVMTLVLCAVPLALVRAFGWLAARRGAAGAPVSPTALASATPPMNAAALAATSPEGMTRRQMVEAASGLALLGTTGSMLGWGMVRGREAYELDELVVRIAGLPRALDGYVIAQISDIHTGVNVGERMLREGLEVVRRAKADLLVVTGDMVDSDAAFAPLFARMLADAAPRDGVFACLGNHDYYAGAPRVAAALRAAGVRTLVNEGLLVRPGDGGGFALLGVDDIWSYRYPGGKRVSLSDALGQVPASAPRILLSHQPPTVDMWAGQVALQLSGHTHGGQINPFGLRPADVFFHYVSGRYDVVGSAGMTTLNVNRGFGTVGPPARVNAPPEVTRVVLVSA